MRRSNFERRRSIGSKHSCTHTGLYLQRRARKMTQHETGAFQQSLAAELDWEPHFGFLSSSFPDPPSAGDARTPRATLPTRPAEVPGRLRLPSEFTVGLPPGKPAAPRGGEVCVGAGGDELGEVAEMPHILSNIRSVLSRSARRIPLPRPSPMGLVSSNYSTR